MADTRGMQDIFGLDIDKLAKGFGKSIYNFLEECQVRKMKGDSVRWFQKKEDLIYEHPFGCSNSFFNIYY